VSEHTRSFARTGICLSPRYRYDIALNRSRGTRTRISQDVRVSLKNTWCGLTMVFQKKGLHKETFCVIRSLLLLRDVSFSRRNRILYYTSLEKVCMWEIIFSTATNGYLPINNAFIVFPRGTAGPLRRKMRAVDSGNKLGLVKTIHKLFSPIYRDTSVATRYLL